MAAHAGLTALAEQLLLVVENDAVAREWRAASPRREGYAVATAGDGAEVLDYLRSNPPPDLILLDMLMPVLEGWHFLNELRRCGVPLLTPIVITTSTILTREWAADNGCAGFLPKPFATADLLAEVRRCLALTKGRG